MNAPFPSPEPQAPAPLAGGAILTHRGVVYPWQCDHVGHMNVMWYTGKFDEANWSMIAALGVTPAFLRESGRGMAAVEQTITYKRELFAGDLIEVTSRVLEMRKKAVRFRHEMRDAITGELAATSEITAVHLDKAAHKACAFPAELKARGEAMASQSQAVILEG
ncbi:MAG: acyl-CoA thioesterase [Proteobacteria bacterium]|nr:acyl-CoA thioesterase [Pseudomonadota bacterium]